MQKNSLKDEGNIKNTKLTYINDLWMYFDDIKNRYTENRNKIKSLLNLFKQKNAIEVKYSIEIKKLSDEYISKYNNKNKVLTPCEQSINKLVDIFKEESNLIDEKIKFVSDNLIKPLNGFINSQNACSNEILKLIECSKIDYRLITQLLREKEINLMKVGKDLEISMYKLEKEIISSENKKEEVKNSEEENKNIENQNQGGDVQNKDEIAPNNEDNIVKYRDIKKQNLKKVKDTIFEYENFINIANKEREKYIKFNTQIYNHFQILDEKFVSIIKDKFKIVLEKEIEFMNKHIEIKSNALNNYINLINVEEDINAYINSKIIKFKIPPEIEYIYYYPQVVLKKRNDPVESKITEKINKELNEIFLKNKKKDKDDISIFLRQCIKLILEEKDYEKSKLLKIIEEKKNRKYFFEALNQYRVEGIFELPKKTFEELSFLFNFIIKLAINDEDYESFKILIILSQTFYLSENKDLLLHSSIDNHQIWKDKLFWENIINYSITEELNDPKQFDLLMDEDYKGKKDKINSTIISNIYTYVYNMKLFNFPKDKYKELINDIINKYKINPEVINSSLNIINDEIQNDEKKDDEKVIEKDEEKKDEEGTKHNDDGNNV